MKTKILQTLSVCAVLLFCAASLAFAATECSIVPSSIPWDESDQGTWVSDTYTLTIECTDAGAPVQGYMAQFDVNIMEGSNWENNIAILTVYSNPTDSNGKALIIVPLIHVQKNTDGKYIHICPFDDIRCTGGVSYGSSSSQSALANSSGVASLTASATGCLNTLPGCCSTTITITCCTPNIVYQYCTTVPAGSCIIGTTNPDPCTIITTTFDQYGTCNYCTGICEPGTAINLTSFTAKPGKKSVILNWTTEIENDNAGFNIWRADAEDGEYVKVNSDLIPADAQGVNGASYQFIDHTVKNRFKKYFYKLGDVNTDGAETMHGPIRVGKPMK